MRDADERAPELRKENERLRAEVARLSSRAEDVEQELSKLANLYVASHQLHSTLDLPSVIKHLRELLGQLVGARAHAIYVADSASGELVPVASDGLDFASLSPLRIGSPGEVPDGAAGVIERVFHTGLPHIAEGPLTASVNAPVACVPMRMGERVLGVIVVNELFAQKERFSPLDFELFALLGAHAATALTGALLYADAGGKVPNLSPLRALEPRMADAKF